MKSRRSLLQAGAAVVLMQLLMACGEGTETADDDWLIGEKASKKPPRNPPEDEPGQFTFTTVAA